jgi:hypothetical protein
MKNCLICQTGRDQVSLTRLPVSKGGSPWGEFLVCANCLQVLGKEEIKNLVRIAVEENSYEPSNVLLAGEGEDSHPSEPITLDLPISPALLRDPQAFSRLVGEKVGGKLWELHRGGVSEAMCSTSLTPDGEGGYVFSALFVQTPATAG